MTERWDPDSYTDEGNLRGRFLTLAAECINEMEEEDPDLVLPLKCVSM